MRLTVNRVMSYKPCYKKEKIEALFAGRKIISLHDVAGMDIPDKDKVWVFTRPNVLSNKIRDKWLEIIITRAINTAKHVYINPGWNKWTDNWLDGTNRSAYAAYAAYAAANAAANADANAAAYAAHAARAANADANAAAYAAHAANAAANADAYAAFAAANAAANADAYAAYAAAYAAANAAANADAYAAFAAAYKQQVEDMLSLLDKGE